MQIITPAEAALRLGKHRSTVYRMIEREEVWTEPILVPEVGTAHPGRRA